MTDTTPHTSRGAIRYQGDCIEVLGNPLISGLPRARTDPEWAEILSATHRESVDSALSPTARAVRIGATDGVHVPLLREIKLALELEALLIDGYHHRAPTDWSKSLTARERREIHLCAILDDVLPKFVGCQRALALLGVTGAGKSTTLRAILSSWPAVIMHSVDRQGSPKVVQVVWALLDAPVGKSLKGLCVAILGALDTALGSNYVDSLASKSTDVLRPLIVKLLAQYSVGLLVIDESQVMKGKGISQKALVDFLVSLMNTAGVPIVIVGTPATRELLRTAPRLARRVASSRHYWNALEPTNENWVMLAEGMLAPSRLGLRFEDTHANPTGALHELTEGVPAYLSLLLSSTQRRLLRRRLATFSIKDLEASAKELPEEIRAQIAFLRSERLKREVDRSGTKERRPNLKELLGTTGLRADEIALDDLEYLR